MKISGLQIPNFKTVSFSFLTSLFLLLFSSQAFAATRYWVGNDGANTNVATNWKTTNPAACGGGNAPAAPTSNDDVIFDPDCDNGATINANLSANTITLQSGYTGTVTQSAGITVATDAASGYNQAGGTFAGGNSSITITNGGFTLSGGTFTNTSGGLNVERNFNISGGTFTNTGKTVTFIDSNTADDTTLTCSAALGGTFVITKNSGGDFTLSSGCTIDLGANPTSAMGSSSGGTHVNNGTMTIASGTWTMNGQTSGGNTFTNNGTITHSGSGWDMNDITFTNNSGKTVTYSGTAITIERSFNQSGTFDLSGVTITFGGTSTADDATLTCGTSTIAGIVINKTNASSDFTLGSHCTVSGNFTRTNGPFTNPASAYVLTVQGDFSMSTTDTFGGANLTLTMGGSSNKTITQNAGAMSGVFKVDKSGGASTQLSTNFTTGSTCHVVEGVFDVNARTFTCGSTFTVEDGGTLQVQGAESVTAPTLDSGSTVLYVGDNDNTPDHFTITTLASTYHHLTIDGAEDGASKDTFQLGAAITVNGNLTITDGTLDVTTTSYPINLAGNWSNSGTFAENSGTVTLNGTDQSLSGNSTFYNLTKSVTTARTLTFEKDKTQTITNTMTLTGQSGALLSLRSSEDDADGSTTDQWKIDPQGTRTISYLDVKDSNNINATQISTAGFNITNSGTNTGWIFGIDISGVVYTNEAKSANVGAGITVGISVNGGAKSTVDTTAGGAFSFSSIAVSANETILIFIDDESSEANFVSQAADTATNITGLELYTNKIVLSHQTSGPMTNALLATADNSADDDIHYTISGSNVTFDTGYELWIASGKTYTPGGTVEADDLQTEGTGTFNPAANAVTIHGSWEHSSTGTFTSTGTVTFDSSSSETITTGGDAFYHLTFNGSGSWTITGTDLDVDGAFTLSNGTFTAPTGTFTVGGNLTLTGGAFAHSSGTVTMDGASSATLNSSATLYNLTINKTAAADADDDVTLATNNLTITNKLTITDGEFLQSGDVNLTVNEVSVAADGLWNVTGGIASDHVIIAIGSGFVTNAGMITFNGLAGTSSGGDIDVIEIRSSTSGTQRTWAVSGSATTSSFTMVDVDVKDQKTSGSLKINVTSGTNTGNNTNWIFQALLDHLAVTTSESTTLAAGSSINVTITARDNNTSAIMSGYEGNKTLTFSGPSAAPDSTTPKASDYNGTSVAFGSTTTVNFTCGANGCKASVALVLYKAETVSVDVTDGAYSSSGSASYDLDLTVQPGAAASLKFLIQPAPLSLAASTVFSTQPVAGLVDTYQNTTTSASNEIKLEAVLASDGVTIAPGTLSAAANPLAASSGSASFSGVKYNASGTIKLKASSDGLTSALSDTITVIQTKASIHLTNVNGQERSSYMIGESVYVEVVDEDENVDSAVKETVTVTVRNARTNDVEKVTLEETAVSTGIFINKGSAKPNAPLPSVRGVSGNPDNFLLETSSTGDIVTVRYVDDDDSNDEVDDSASFGSLSLRVASNVSGPITAGAPFNLTVTAVQGVGQTAQIATNYQGTATLTLDYVSPTSGTKKILPEQVRLSSGIAIVLVSYDDAGTIKIKAVDTADSNLQGESTELVFIPASFEVALPHSTEQVSRAFEVNREFDMTVTAKNLAGSPTPNYAGTANISVIPEDGAALGTLFIPAVSSFSQGVRTISNRYDSWGKVHFEVSDSVYSSAKGESVSVQFIPKKLDVSLSPPPGTRAGQNLFTYYQGESFTVTIDALDYFDHVIENYGGKIKINNTTGLIMPPEYQFLSSDAGSYSFNVEADHDEASFTLSVLDDQVPAVMGTSSPSAQVLKAQVVVESTYGGTGRPVSVTVKIVDSNGRVIKTDSTTVVQLVFYVSGEKLSEDSLLPTLVLPDVTTLELVNGVTRFNLSSTKVETISVFAQPVGASSISETVPGTVNIGSVGQRGVRILSWAEIRSPVKQPSNS